MSSVFLFIIMLLDALFYMLFFDHCLSLPCHI